jgi:protocatechuate 4,5-dioxygenase, alpha chain
LIWVNAPCVPADQPFRMDGARPKMDGTRGRRVIPGTPIFDGAAALKGYALNKMCFSFNDAASDVLALIAAGGNIYYLAKLAGIFGLSVQDIGAQQTGMSVEAFKAKLLAAGD